MKLTFKLFEKELLKHYSPLKHNKNYSYWLADHYEKLEKTNNVYYPWLKKTLSYLQKKYNLGKTILDFGCSTGEIALLISKLGFSVSAMEKNEKTIHLAKILAQENKAAISFLTSTAGNIPLPSKSVDIITLFHVIEHIDDKTLKLLLPEWQRICKGVIYLTTPNKIKKLDDHTRIPLLTIPPRNISLLILKLLGKKYAYSISKDGTWDVYARSYPRLKKILSEHFHVYSLEATYSFPLLSQHSKMYKLISLFRRLHINPNLIKPYLNLILIPR